MFDLQNIQTRLKTGQPVSTQEYVYFLRNNPEAFWAFMVENNPGSIHHMLRDQLGYIELGFAPENKTLARFISTMLDKRETKELKYLLDNFEFDKSKVTPAFLEEFQKQFAQ